MHYIAIRASKQVLRQPHAEMNNYDQISMTMTTSKNMIAYALFALASISNASGQSISLADGYMLQASAFKKNMEQDSALVYFEKAAIEFQKLGSNEKLIEAYNQIGIVLTRQDQYEKAKTYLEKALSTGRSTLDTNSLAIATTYISMGVIYNAEGNYDRSLSCHHKALSIRLLMLGEYNAEVATSYGNIGNVHRNNKEFEKSINAHLNAMKIRERVFGPESPEIIESYVGLGNAYREEKEYDTSLAYFNKALKNKIIQRGDEHKDLMKYHKYLSDVYYLNGDKLKGDEYKVKYEEMERKTK